MSVFAAIDLKSFYASVECIEHGFDPLTTNLVVADKSRTEKTICLAVSPSLKSYGVGGRPRLFEVVSRVKEVNRERLRKCGKFVAKSYDDNVLKKHPDVALDYYVATPRMAYYIRYSSMIYNIYLKYVSKEDIHVYSIDEVFIDLSKYQKIYGMNARELAIKMIKDVYHTTGITATCGIGDNLYLAKIAMDIVAKKMPADEDGVRVAELNEMTYREQLWDHQPLTDFWRIGKGIANRLASLGLFTQGDIAMMSLEDEDSLYKMFGVNAELIIDHAWGYEPVRIEDIKVFKPVNNSLNSGQVLKEPYPFSKARLVAREMADDLALDLFEKQLCTDQIVLTVFYDVSNNKKDIEYVKDWYGKQMPKQAHGTFNLSEFSNIAKVITDGTLALFDKIVDRDLTIRRIFVSANHTINDKEVEGFTYVEQTDLFTDYEQKDKQEKARKEMLKKEKNAQAAILKIQKKYGKTAIIKGNNLEEGATSLERKQQIGGHKA